jgi:hypothetical protein
LQVPACMPLHFRSASFPLHPLSSGASSFVTSS